MTGLLVAGASNMRAVFDTNILISGLFWRGAAYECILAAEAGLIQLVLSEPILDELREKLIERFGDDALSADQRLSQFRRMSHVVSLLGQTGWVAADPDDDKIIETAILADASHVVSGDHHLLELDPIEGITIVSAKEFLGLVKRDGLASQE